MTAKKHLKQLVRERMRKTGERYAAARLHVIKAAPAPAVKDPRLACHRPGSIPATTALRILLTHRGVMDPHTKRPFTEAMLFGLAGGVGIGTFQFFYAKEDFASFFIAGLHEWWDVESYVAKACRRLGLNTAVKTAGGAKAAEKNLREQLADGPVIAWVDAAMLPHRAMPAFFQGGGYHVIVVYAIDDQAGTALIGDLTDEPIAISLKDLTAARARIKKFKFKTLSLPAAPATLDLSKLIREGLAACHVGLVRQRMKNFTLSGLKAWAERLHGGKDKESWDHVFQSGANLWRGLCGIYEYIEHRGTGGGLCRPIFADALAEAAGTLEDEALQALAARYAVLGAQWSELAHAALPDAVPAFKQARELMAERAEMTAAGASPEEVRAVWGKLAALEKAAKDRFPLSAEAAAELRSALQQRVFMLHEAETAAHAALGEWLGG